MLKPSDAAVVIVGAGLVGASLALALARRLPFLSIRLIDSQAPALAPQEGDFDPRVVALNPASQRFLAAHEAWPHSRVCPYRAMQVWDGEGSGSIEFSARELGLPQLGWILENNQVLSLLHGLIQQTPQIHWQHSVVTELHRQDAGWHIHTDSGETLHSNLVLACDGARSAVRQFAQIPVRQWPYGHTAIVCRVQSELPHQHTAYQRFSHQGPLAFLPLLSAGERDSSIVWSLDEACAQQMLKLDDDTFKTALEAALEGRLGRIQHCDARQALPLFQCHATRYYLPGLALVGDAAHAIHPLAGQGVNLGLADVNALVTQLERAHTRGLPIHHSSALNRYERARMPHNLAAMAAMESFKHLFGNPNPYVGLLRNVGLNLAGQWPGLKQQFMRLASGG